MTFRLIEAEKAQHPVSLLCSVLGVTRAGYYAWRQRGPSRRALGDAELASLIGRVFVDSLETYGAPRVHAELREAHGIRVGRKRVARLMRQLELEGVSRRGKRRRTTIADPAAAPAPDVVGRRFKAARPNELWLADIPRGAAACRRTREVAKTGALFGRAREFWPMLRLTVRRM